MAMSYFIPQEVIDMAKIKTRYPALLAAKSKREKRKIERMDVVREAGISYPTAARWELESVVIERLDSDTVIRLCKYFDCELGELLYIIDEKKGDNG